MWKGQGRVFATGLVGWAGGPCVCRSLASSVGEATPHRERFARWRVSRLHRGMTVAQGRGQEMQACLEMSLQPDNPFGVTGGVGFLLFIKPSPSGSLWATPLGGSWPPCT